MVVPMVSVRETTMVVPKAEYWEGGEVGLMVFWRVAYLVTQMDDQMDYELVELMAALMGWTMAASTVVWMAAMTVAQMGSPSVAL